MVRVCYQNATWLIYVPQGQLIKIVWTSPFKPAITNVMPTWALKKLAGGVGGGGGGLMYSYLALVPKIFQSFIPVSRWGGGGDSCTLIMPSRPKSSILLFQYCGRGTWDHTSHLKKSLILVFAWIIFPKVCPNYYTWQIWGDSTIPPPISYTD